MRARFSPSLILSIIWRYNGSMGGEEDIKGKLLMFDAGGKSEKWEVFM